MSSTEVSLLPPSYVRPSGDLPTYSQRSAASAQPLFSQASQRGPDAAGGPSDIDAAVFKYELKNRKRKPWAWFVVRGDPALSKTLPTFVEGSRVEGDVCLDLEDKELIQSVSISVLGRIITGANPGDDFIFVEVPLVLWSKATSGDPRDPESTGHFSGKLQGAYSWPYSLKIPSEVNLLLGGEQKTFKLPQTFLERHTRASVQYDLVLKVIRGKLRPTDKLAISFGYIPIVKPDPPSVPRQIAYLEGTPLPGPEADQDGWHVCAPVTIRGWAFGQRAMEAQCTLSVSKPLSYTRGSVIPFALSIMSRDTQALDLISSPNAVVLRLRRCVKYHEFVGNTVDSASWRDQYDEMESAVWWPASEGGEDETAYRRRLLGEIHLNTNLKPSSAMAHFRIEYSVLLHPFDATAFKSDSSEPLLEQSVEIVTAYASGPRPLAFAPPVYEAPTTQHGDRYYHVFPGALSM